MNDNINKKYPKTQHFVKPIMKPRRQPQTDGDQ
jgi:hypothetical protein